MRTLPPSSQNISARAERPERSATQQRPLLAAPSIVRSSRNHRVCRTLCPNRHPSPNPPPIHRPWTHRQHSRPSSVRPRLAPIHHLAPMVRPIPQRSSMTDWQDLNDSLNPTQAWKRRRLERTTQLIQQHQPPIVSTNPFQTQCAECGASSWALFSLLLENALRQVQAFCADCGHKDARALPHRFIDPDTCPVYNDKREGFCMRCGKFGTEEHHYAPHHLFADSWQWGTVRLCVEHHREWHRIVTPNMSHTRRKA